MDTIMTLNIPILNSSYSERLYYATLLLKEMMSMLSGLSVFTFLTTGAKNSLFTTQ